MAEKNAGRGRTTIFLKNALEALRDALDQGKKRGAKRIHNRDISLLGEIYGIMQEINSLEMRRQWQQDKAKYRSQSMAGVGGGGPPRGLDDMMAVVSDLDEQQDAKAQEYRRMLKDAERILNGIPGFTLRSFVRMTYVDMLGKGTVMLELGLSEWDYRMIRESVEQAPDMAHVVWPEKFENMDAV